MSATTACYELQGESGLRKIMQQAPVAMAIIMGPDYIITIANEKQLALWQKKEEELLGKPLFSVFPEVAHQGFRDKLAEVYRTGVSYTGEEVSTQFYRNGQLTQAWFDFIYEPLKNDLGQIEGIMVISTEVTEKVVARRKLEEKKEQLHYTIKLGTQVPWTTSAGGKLEDINEKWLELTGMPPAEVLHKGWEHITHPDDCDTLRSTWRQSIASGQPFYAEHRVKVKDGSYRWMRSQAFLRRSDSGHPLCWHGSTEDIHEQRQALLQTQLSEQKYRSLFERMNQGFCIVDVQFDAANNPVDYLFLECNSRFEDQTGLRDAPGKTARQLLPDLEEHWFQIYGKVALTGQPLSFIEGSEVMGRWFEVNVYKFGDESSRKVAILFSDISERKRGEESLRLATLQQQSTLSLLQSLLQNAPVGFAFTDLNHCYTHVNDLFAQMTGCSAADHIGRHIKEVQPQTGDRISAYLNQVTATKLPLTNVEIAGTTPENPGTVRNWLAGYYPVFDAQSGAVAQVGVVVTEVTDQKRAEQQMAESEKRYHDIYNQAPVSIWEEDFTAVRQHVLQLKEQGIRHLAPYFQQHPEELAMLVDQVVIKDVNQASLDLYGGTKAQLLSGLHHFFVEETLATFVEEMQTMADGGGHFEAETLVCNHKGEKIHILVRIDFPKDDDYSNVHVILFDITDRKKSEYASRESEERFRNLADNAPVMIWITDKDGYCHYLNKQWYDYTGQSEEEGHGIGWTNAVHPEESAKAAQAFLQASNTQSAYRIAFRLRKWDGTYRWVIDSAVPRLDAAGNFIGYIGSVVDIHDQKTAQEQLQKLHSHLELSTSAAGVGTWSYNLATGVLDWSDLHKAMWGYAPAAGELSYEDWHNVIVEEDRPKALAEVQEATLHKADYANEYRIQRKDDGSIRWMRSFGRFLLDEAGEPSILTGITIDITGAKQAEIALRESEARFRNLADNTPMWVWLADEQGNITYANKEELEFFGATDLSGISGKNWELLVHPEDLEDVYRTFDAAIQERRAYSLEARLLNRRTNQYEWFHFRGVPRQEGGLFRGMIGTAINIHSQKLFTQELERMVKERTLELERSNEDLRQFAHVASHDLKEPVRKIMTFHNRLVDEYQHLLPPSAMAYLSKIEKAAKRSNDMIEGLLRSTSVYSNANTIHPTDLNDLVRQVEGDIDLVLEKSGATIHCSHLPVVEGMHMLLYHLFYNLILNALKFGRPGVPVLLDISAEVYLKGQRPFTRIVFHDNGIGFSQAFAEDIFQPFIRLHSKDQFEGAGLGLAFCRQVAERHGGTITAQGTEGAGATFVVDLPLFQNSQASTDVVIA